MRRISRKGLRAIAITVIATLAVGAAAQAAGHVPILAGPWSSGQKGYGKIKPRTIYNGGDPTGLVKHITWSSWGGKRAMGTGTSWWVGPHQSVNQGHFERGAKIVLFHLSRCHGRRAYDAIEWFFPRHGQHFDPRSYINSCTGKYHIH
jgi:hypothetical protein